MGCCLSNSFQQTRLITAPVLCYPQFGPDAQFILEMDASSVGLGAILAQKQEDE